jgi:hypothetical protein
MTVGLWLVSFNAAQRPTVEGHRRPTMGERGHAGARGLLDRFVPKHLGRASLDDLAVASVLDQVPISRCVRSLTRSLTGVSWPTPAASPRRAPISGRGGVGQGWSDAESVDAEGALDARSGGRRLAPYEGTQRPPKPGGELIHGPELRTMETNKTDPMSSWPAAGPSL